MFTYSPIVADKSGEIMAAGTIGAASTNVATASTRADTMKQLGSYIGSVIQQFAGMYAENKALDAKAGAYKDFLGRHGAQLGLDPEWIKGFAKAPRDQQLAAGDLLTGNLGQRYFGYNYLVKQNEMYPRTGGGGAGAGGAAGGGGSQRGYQVGQGWVGY